MTNIEIATKVAWSFLDTPYMWGGDDPMAGLDCSGFCIEILQSVGLLPRSGDWTAQMLYERFVGSPQFYTKNTIPQEGFLVFWHSKDNKDKIIHVEYCLNKELSIGASGGGSKTITVKDAIAQNAYIKVRPFRSRSYIYGFVDPFVQER